MCLLQIFEKLKIFHYKVNKILIIQLKKYHKCFNNHVWLLCLIQCAYKSNQSKSIFSYLPQFSKTYAQHCFVLCYQKFIGLLFVFFYNIYICQTWIHQSLQSFPHLQFFEHLEIEWLSYKCPCKNCTNPSLHLCLCKINLSFYLLHTLAPTIHNGENL